MCAWVAPTRTTLLHVWLLSLIYRERAQLLSKFRLTHMHACTHTHLSEKYLNLCIPINDSQFDNSAIVDTTTKQSLRYVLSTDRPLCHKLK